MASKDVSAIIRGLKSHFGVRSDEALSEKIGVAKSTIATWRRRKLIPRRTMDSLAAEYGLTVEAINEDRKDELRDYVLRQCHYHIVITLANALPSEERAGYVAALADDFAIIEPYLRRVLVKNSSSEIYKGLSGAVKFLMQLRSGEISMTALLDEAKADRMRDLGK